MDKYFDETLTIITNMGIVKINKDNKEMFDDLGLNFINNIGPYILATINIKPISEMEEINQQTIDKCYISHNGIIEKINNDVLLNTPIYKIESIYNINNGYKLISFDKHPYLKFDNKFQQFYVKVSKCIQCVSIMEVYNLYEEFDYHFIINPSSDILKEVANRFDMFITDNNGWVIADGKMKNKNYY
ncbi:MHC class II inhibitor [Cotia virus SPAn232]|uniref:MHC class II inhibitor n=2 Tax=Cotia virus TaxID=39444 RepID=H6TAB0_9POXV|nr:MHC class II inhibitor [Cotia virus SPAn232]AFB76944.1 MHC class II inhibitor [Cotia virus SPAn232]AIT70757.1 MHC class II inhibitor [Cotia virus]